MSLPAARPQITVYSEKNEPTDAPVCLPAVFEAPIRPDIVSFIHQEAFEIAKSKMQPTHPIPQWPEPNFNEVVMPGKKAIPV